MTGAALATFMSIVLVGCSEKTFCKEATCSDGIVVQLSRAMPDSFIVEIETRAYTAVQEFPQGLSLDSIVFFEDLRVSSGTVRASWATGEAETTVVFAYENVYPNGPDCGGDCSQAAVRLSLP